MLKIDLAKIILKTNFNKKFMLKNLTKKIKKK